MPKAIDSTAAVFSYPKGELKMEQDKKGLYSHPRWNDKQLPVVTGYRELTKEEKERVDREFKEYCKKYKIEIVEDI